MKNHEWKAEGFVAAAGDDLPLSEGPDMGEWDCLR